MLLINGERQPETDTLNGIITIDGLHDVPAKDSTDNLTIRDVLGNKTDERDGNSIYSMLKVLKDRFHNEQKVYPELADPVVLTSAVGAWNLGTIIEIIPANAITSDFDIHHIVFSSASATDDYEIKLYSGASGSEVVIASTKTYKQAQQAGSAPSPIAMATQPGNTRISAAVASGTGGDTIGVSVLYHDH